MAFIATFLQPYLARLCTFKPHNRGYLSGGTSAGNTATAGGGIFNFTSGSATVDASTVSANTASGDANSSGGGIYNESTLIIQNGSTIGGAGAGNSANYGGGVYSYSGSTTVDASTVSANLARNGGGIFNATATLIIRNGSLIGGAGAGNSAIDSSTVSANSATWYGGGISNEVGSVGATLVIQNGSLIGGAGAGNTATYGGGIYNGSNGTTTIDASTVSSNSTTKNGGGIFNSGSMMVTGSKFLTNTATLDGDAVYNDSTNVNAVNVTGSCIVGNGSVAFFNKQFASQTATGNWWGASDGPGPVGTGHGDTISNNVDFSGYLTAPILGCPTLWTPVLSPTNLAATTSNQTQINLTWTDNSTDETEFRIERSLDGSTGWSEIAIVSADTTSYSDPGLICSTVYYYRVRAFRGGDGQYSDYSNIASAVTSPCAPSGLSANAVSPGHVNLAWADNSTDETEFHVERSLDGMTGWTEVATVGADTTSYPDMGLTCSTTYYYRVRGFRAGDGWYSDYSSVASAVTGPCAPSNLSTAGAAPGQIALAWADNSPDETAFHVERSADGLTGWTEIGTTAADALGYTDSGLTCNTAYSYRVRAFRASDGLYSDYSSVASAVTGPCAPSGLSASAISRTQISLGWTDNSDETEFLIERSRDGVTGWRSIGTVGADVTSYVDTALMCETTYYYRVRAFRSGDGLYSDYSNVASATTADCEVATNGSFEMDSDGDHIPDAWAGGGLTGRDGQDCTIARIGQCSFLMTSGGKDKSLSQVVSQGGGAGEILTLSLWVKADSTSSDGLLQARVTIYYADGTNEVQTLDLATGTYDWQHFALTFTTARPYIRLEITLVMNTVRGSVWFDKVSLAQEGQFPPVAPPIPIEP